MKPGRSDSNIAKPTQLDRGVYSYQYIIGIGRPLGSPIIPSRASTMHSKDCRGKAKYGFYLPPKDSQSFAEYRAIYGEPRIASELGA